MKNNSNADQSESNGPGPGGPGRTRQPIKKTLEELVSETIRDKIRAIQKFAYEQILESILNECINVEKVRRGKIVPSSLMDAIVHDCHKVGYTKLTAPILYRRIVSYKLKHNIDTSNHYNTISASPDSNKTKRQRYDDDSDDNDDDLEDFIVVDSDESEEHEEPNSSKPNNKKRKVEPGNNSEGRHKRKDYDNGPATEDDARENDVNISQNAKLMTEKQKVGRPRKSKRETQIPKKATTQEMKSVDKQEKAKKMKRLQIAVTDTMAYLDEQERKNGYRMPQGAHQDAKQRMYQKFGYLCTMKQIYNFRMDYKKNNHTVTIKRYPVIIDHYDEMIKDENNMLLPLTEYNDDALDDTNSAAVTAMGEYDDDNENFESTDFDLTGKSQQNVDNRFLYHLKPVERDESQYV